MVAIIAEITDTYTNRDKEIKIEIDCQEEKKTRNKL